MHFVTNKDIRDCQESNLALELQQAGKTTVTKHFFTSISSTHHVN